VVCWHKRELRIETTSATPRVTIDVHWHRIMRPSHAIEGILSGDTDRRWLAGELHSYKATAQQHEKPEKPAAFGGSAAQPACPAFPCRFPAPRQKGERAMPNRLLFKSRLSASPRVASRRFAPAAASALPRSQQCASVSFPYA